MNHETHETHEKILYKEEVKENFRGGGEAGRGKEEDIMDCVFDTALIIHKRLGPGLLEDVFLIASLPPWRQ